MMEREERAAAQHAQRCAVAPVSKFASHQLGLDSEAPAPPRARRSGLRTGGPSLRNAEQMPMTAAQSQVSSGQIQSSQGTAQRLHACPTAHRGAKPDGRWRTSRAPIREYVAWSSACVRAARRPSAGVEGSRSSASRSAVPRRTCLRKAGRRAGGGASESQRVN